MYGFPYKIKKIITLFASCRAYIEYMKSESFGGSIVNVNAKLIPQSQCKSTCCKNMFNRLVSVSLPQNVHESLSVTFIFLSSF